MVLELRKREGNGGEDYFYEKLGGWFRLDVYGNNHDIMANLEYCLSSFVGSDESAGSCSSKDGRLSHP